MIIDTHIHLDTKKFNKDLSKVLFSAKESGVNRFIIPSIDSNHMSDLIKLSESYENIYFAAGHHPNNISPLNIESIIEAANHKKCLAIGECGLDWFRIPKGALINDVKKNQIDIFKEQIKLSQALNKPLILHSRDTDLDMVNTLNEFTDIFGVIHCYVGSSKLLELLDKGFYFGIGGVLTYKSAKDLHENVKKIPLNKLVLETDGPYLTPEPFRNKRNESKYLKIIIKRLSEILKIEIYELEKIIEENTFNLFSDMV